MPDGEKGDARGNDGACESRAPTGTAPGVGLLGERAARGDGQLAAGGIPVRRTLRERGFEDVVEADGELRPELPDRWRRLVQVSKHDGEIALPARRASRR